MVHACIGSCMHQVLQLQNLCLIANRHRIHGTQYSLGHSTHWDTVLIGTQYSLGNSTHWDTVLIGTHWPEVFVFAVDHNMYSSRYAMCCTMQWHSGPLIKMLTWA